MTCAVVLQDRDHLVTAEAAVHQPEGSGCAHQHVPAHRIPLASAGHELSAAVKL
jgi:hypothetical protein